MIEVTEPGVYDLPDEDYHADPVPDGSLSSSGARALLPPSCPARFRWAREHGRPPKSAFDFGHAAHLAVLGAGADLEVIDAADWRTKAAREARDEARATGRIPVLAADHRKVLAMADALRAHPVAGLLLDPTLGTPEQSAFWVDEPTGVWRRARFDFLPHPGDGRMLVTDYKTCARADREALQRSVLNFGYHQQAAWYLDAVEALGLADDPAFLFVFQEHEPPYPVVVAELDTSALRIGSHLNRRALEVYVQCAAADTWPGYAEDVELLSLPAWAENRFLEEMYA